MNQIQFRGKRKDNNEWIYGYIIQEPNGRTFIGTYMSGGMWDWVEVETETVGQYIGLTDKNGIKIFKGDIVRKHGDYEVIFDSYRFEAKGYYNTCYDCPCDFFSEEVYRIEVIGNRWDNPELMGEE